MICILYNGTVCQWIRKRYAYFYHISAGVLKCHHHIFKHRKARITCCYKGHKCPASFPINPLETFFYSTHTKTSPITSDIVSTSLSPRPDIFKTIMSSLFSLAASSMPYATAWALSMAGIIPSIVRSEEHTSELQSREKLVCS